MLQLRPRSTPGATVSLVGPGHWRLSIPAGPAGLYRLAQLDDYWHLHRAAFPWLAPARLRLEMRASGQTLPGTWGFGFWNDPFSATMGLGGVGRRLPTLPNAAWFFYASPPNYLALHDEHPAQGFLAATFSAPHLPVLALAPVLPLLLWPGTARLLRPLGRRVIREDAVRLLVDPTAWHTYELEWREDAVRFAVDGALALETGVVPGNRLGLVIWIDNQYAAFPRARALRFGALASPAPAWLELQALDCAPCLLL